MIYTQVVSVLTKPANYFYPFILSLAKYNHVPVLIGWGEQYTGGNYKLKRLKHLAKQLEGKTKYILYTDCYDSVFTQSPNDCGVKFEEMNVKVLVSGTPTCHPLKELAPQFPDIGRNRYINTGGFIAKPADLVALLEKLDVDGHSAGLDDQALLSTEYVKDPSIVTIDSQCQIFQTLYNANSDLEFQPGAGYYNKVTKNYPSIIHGDGRTSLDETIANLRLLETSTLVEMY